MEDRDYELRMAVMDAARKSVSIYDGPAVFLDGFTKLPDAVGDLLATHWVVSEVNNGALPQFFSNSTGVLAPEAAMGLKRMGLKRASEVLLEAMSLFGPVYPRERKPRFQVVQGSMAKGASPQQTQLLDELLRLSVLFLDALGEDCIEFDRAFEQHLFAHVPVA